jgi:hypothetical protein
MKFISFAILSALATLTTSAPAPSQDQCVPEQGTRYNYDYDVTGNWAFEQCTWTSLVFESGVVKTRGAYNFFDTGSGFHSCGKHHSHIAGGKAVDAQGNRYNIIQMSNGNYDSSYDYITYASEGDNQYQSKYKIVGQGPLTNSVISFSYKCHYTYDTVNGYKEVCSKNEFKFKCSN